MRSALRSCNAKACRTRSPSMRTSSEWASRWCEPLPNRTFPPFVSCHHARAHDPEGHARLVARRARPRAPGRVRAHDGRAARRAPAPRRPGQRAHRPRRPEHLRQPTPVRSQRRLHEVPARPGPRSDARVLREVFFGTELQWVDEEDFTKYPRDLARDRTLASERGVDCLFVPALEAVYPQEPLVRIASGPMVDTWEGAARPGHFSGFLTVVAKLFHIVEPDVAVFGRKHFQQA